MTRRLLAGAIVALIPALAGCEAGQNAPALNFHPAANGAYQTQGGVTINNAFVLGPAMGQSLSAGSDAGLFLSMYSSSGDQLDSVSAPGSAASVTLTDGPVNLPASSSVNLTGPGPEIVLHDLSKSLSGGQDITLKLNFANSGQATVQVPVVPHAYAYSTYDQPPAPAPSPTQTASTTATTHHKKKHHASATATASPGATTTALPTATPTPSATS
jgi:copper(I)-binding protein